MKLFIFAIYDAASQAFRHPFFAPHVGAVSRELEEQVADARAGNFLHSHPQHFELYEFGTFDPVIGRIELLPDRRLVYRLDALCSSPGGSSSATVSRSSNGAMDGPFSSQGSAAQ